MVMVMMMVIVLHHMAVVDCWLLYSVGCWLLYSVDLQAQAPT